MARATATNLRDTVIEMAPESLTTVGGFSRASHSAWFFCTLWWNQKAGQNLAAVWRSWFIGARAALIGVFGIAALLYLPYRTFGEISWWPPLILVALTVAYMLAKLSPVTRPSA